MNINIEYIDSNSNHQNISCQLTRIAFAKHLAVAGQGYAPRPQKLIRIISMFLHYHYYLRRQDFYNNKFSVPPNFLYDPTEKGQFSNLAGKAIADFLSKRIDRSLFTVNYEAAMKLRGIPINGPRPDLLAFTSKAIFAIEAKGYSGGPGNMAMHKRQSQTGPIPVNYSIASVAYNLYQRVKCNYFDPSNENIPYDNELLKGLSKSYYKGLAEFLEYFAFNRVEYQGEKFYQIDLHHPNDRFYPLYCHCCYEICHFYDIKLILPGNIYEFAQQGITNDLKPLLFDLDRGNEELYIDNDRVGLRIRENT